MRIRNRYFLLLDLIGLPIAAYLSFVLRLDSFSLGSYWIESLLFAVLAFAFGVPILHWNGVYARFWPYASVNEALLILRAVALSSAAIAIIHLGLTEIGFVGAQHLPRSIPLIFFALATAAVSTPRFLSRLAREAQNKHSVDLDQRALIVGAGEAGVLAAKELRGNPHLKLQPIGFVDDDPDKNQISILGLPVLGDRQQLPRIIGENRIERVIIAMPTVPGPVIRDVVRLCQTASITPQVLPGIYQLIDGAVHVEQIRNVDIEDLLRREPVKTDLSSVEKLINGRRILVTGAGGSIGSELCRQIFQFGPSDLVLLGHGENSIFSIHEELSNLLAASAIEASEESPRLHTVIADVRSRERVMGVFSQYRPHLVLHASAHKHVPLMERHPSEAVSNNVLGTQNVLDAAEANDTERFVLVSTDKAVNPTSIMGASKRAAELLVHQVAQRTGKAFMVVRFGNVLGSRGSVVVSMKQQIARGGPVTVTDAAMTRYFMTIPEAVQLILQASVLGRCGEIFTFDMGDQIRIVDLARDLIRLSGLTIGEDIEIVYTGARPGEKLYEELFLQSEEYRQTDHSKIFICENAAKAIPTDLTEQIEELFTAALSNQDDIVREELQQLIPGYEPSRQCEQMVGDTVENNQQETADMFSTKNPRIRLESGSFDPGNS